MLKEGINIERETDAGIILEKRHWLDIVKGQEPQFVSHFYSAADEEVVHVNKNHLDIAFVGAKGSSFAANMTERLRVSGANPIVRIGTCGALNERVKLWEPVLTTACYRDEGTSYHYLDPRFPVIASADFTETLKKSLKKHGFSAQSGISMTTDGRWRENAELMKKLSKIGVITIEMETAAIFAVCQFRNLIAAAINIPTDYPLKHEAGDFKGVTDHDVFQKNLESTLVKTLPAVYEAIVQTRKQLKNI